MFSRHRLGQRPLIIFLIAGFSALAIAKVDPEFYSVQHVIAHIHNEKGDLDAPRRFVDMTHHALKTLTFTKPVKALWRLSNELLENLDFEKAFSHKQAERIAKDHVRFRLQGRFQKPDGKTTYLIATDKKSKSVVSTNLLEFNATASLKRNHNPLPGEDLAYGITGKVFGGLGEFSHTDSLRLAEGMLQFLDARNLQRLAPESNWNSAVADQLRANLPNSMAVTERYLRQDFGLRKVAGEASVTELNYVVNVDYRKLEQDYPNIAEWLTGIGDNVDLVSNGECLNRKGHILFQSGLKSAIYEQHFRIFTSSGKIIPFDERGKLYQDEAVQLTKLKKFRATCHAEYSVEVLGLRMQKGRVTFDSRLAQTPDKSVARVRMIKFRPPQVKGAALGFIPPALIDLTIPGSLRGYMRLFGKSLLTANDGLGTRLALVVKRHQPSGNFQAFSKAETALLKNFFLTFGLRVANRYVKPSQATLSEFRSLAERASQATLRDLEAMSVKKAIVEVH